MQLPRQKVDRALAARSTSQQLRRVQSWRDSVERVEKDEHRQDRLAQAECPLCYYVDDARVGGAVCSSRQCGLCEEELHSGSTCVDVLCLPCALQTRLCKRCGADLYLKERRRGQLPEPTPALKEAR